MHLTKGVTMANWASQKLKGESQVIPQVCPNCLGRADVKLRYGHKGLKGWLTNTTYYQSFYYCEPCAHQVEAQARLRAWKFWFFVLGIFGGALAMGFAADTAPKGSALPLLAPLGVLLVLGGMFWLLRSGKHKRYPKSDEQAVWGIAAVYYGSGIDMASSIYRAARQEWLTALVAENPDAVDDETYRRVVGREKPAQSAAAPFGGADPADAAAPAVESAKPQGAAGPFG